MFDYGTKNQNFWRPRFQNKLKYKAKAAPIENPPIEIRLGEIPSSISLLIRP